MFTKRSFILLCLVIYAIMAFGASADIYVSSSEGREDGDGSKKHPYAAIADIPAAERVGSNIKLRRGDVFYENIAGFRDCTISAYGSGEKPLLCGFHILDDIHAWEPVGEGLWRIDLKDESKFSGFKARKSDNQSTIYNVGCIYDFGADTIIGHLVKAPNLLVHDGDFFTIGGNPDTTSVVRDPFRYLYLRSEENPARLGRVGFSVSLYGVRNLVGCTVKDIAITGFSLHGMGHMADCRIENCDLDVIGGAILVGYNKYWVRFGNGIEILNRYHDVSVKGCYISRTYDCATTIQGGNFVNPYNIKFEKNRIYRCRQAFEYFLENNPAPSFVDCCFDNNISYMAGWNDFDTPYRCDADLLSYMPIEAPLEIRGNTFYGSPYFSGYIVNTGIRDNTVYIFGNQFINFYHGIENYPRIMPDQLETYREKFGDNSRFIILERGSKEALKIEKAILKKIRPHSLPARLNIGKQ